MIDGILDLLAAILVLAIVVAVAFGFIVPLTNSEIMQFDAKYEDKAVLNNGVAEYDNPNIVVDYSNYYELYEGIQRRKYSYEEIVLLLSVQDSRMEKPNAINVRNLVTSYDLYSDPSNPSSSGYENKNKNLNDNEFRSGSDKVLQVIQYYGDNHRDIVYDTWSSVPNIGTITINEEYPLIVDEMAAFLTKSDLAHRFTDRSNWTDKQKALGDVLQNTDKKYYITYNFAIPDESKYIKNNSRYTNLYNNKEVYMVQIDGNWKPTSNPVDTNKIYQDYVNEIRENISE